MNLLKTRTRFVLFALAFIMTPCTLYSQALSKQNVIDLHRAAVDDSVLIQKIASDGIDFEMSSDNIIELNKEGISSNVMKALITAAAKTTAHTDFRNLYKEGKYAELADDLKADLESRPNNVKTRTLLIMVYLKLGQKDLALKELTKLKELPPSDETKLYTAKVDELLASLSSQEGTKAKFTESLKNYKAADARELINQLPASPFQKEILSVYLSLYQGNYDEAHKIASNIKVASTADQERIKNIQDQITKANWSFYHLAERIEVYLHSPLVPSACYAHAGAMATTFGEFSSISLTEYLNLIEELSQLAPLNDWVLDLIFHGEMISSKYEDLEAIGDRILKAKGAIKIPFYSNDRYFYVVIDQKNQRLLTQADSHPFSVRYAMKGVGAFSSFGLASTNAFNSELVPFDLGFTQITEISQKARSRAQTQTMMVSKSYALKLEPSGVAPDYALMAYIHCVAGADAQETATNNLGKFIVHVIANPNLKTDLVVPEKIHQSSGTFTQVMLALYGGMASAQGNAEGVQLSSQLSQQLAVDTANTNTAIQAQGATWYSVMTKRAFTFVEGNDFESLEKLVGTL